MPRTAREKSRSDIYHIMLRGINQQNIFEEDWDYERFVAILDKYKKAVNCEIYAYCLMSNHVHLLMREGNEDLSIAMKRIGVSYVSWYNWQYSRKGHLFQDRFKSEAVESDPYLLTVLRYIHQNPVKAGLSKDVPGYKWSSYREYTGAENLADTGYILGLFNEDRAEAIRRFIAFNNEVTNDKCLELPESKKTISDKEIKQAVLERFLLEITTLQRQDQAVQKEVIRYMKGLGGSLRQISRITGISMNKVYRA